MARYESKLLSRRWNGREPEMDIAELERAINQVAAEGWRVVSSAMTSCSAFIDRVTGCLVVLERPEAESEP